MERKNNVKKAINITYDFSKLPSFDLTINLTDVLHNLMMKSQS